MVIGSALELDRVFGALAHPTRRAIVNRLTTDEVPVLELASMFEISQPAVTKHLNVLEEAGLIKRRRDGRFRYCRLRPQTLEDASGWIARTRRHWEDRFEALDRYLEETQKKEEE